MNARVLLFIALVGTLPAAQGPAFPPAAGLFDVKTRFGAVGDGVTDDTEAIRACFAAVSRGHMRTAWFPPGVYLVSDQVWFEHWVYCQGAGRERTIIRLKDHCPGFQDPASPKAILGTTDPAPSTACRNMEFSVHVLDLAVETGVGNPGAIGIEFMSHNGGGLERVDVRAGAGSGLIGVDSRRLGDGPSYCRDVRITGFEVGIAFAGNAFASTWEHVELADQRRAGITNTDHPVTMRRLTSRNRVPALLLADEPVPRRGAQQETGGLTVLLDSTLAGGDPALTAVVRHGGGLFLRGVSTTGYRALLDDRGTIRTGAADGELSIPAITSADPASPLRSLGLPVADTPAMPWTDPATWADVRSFGPLPAATAQDRLWDAPVQGVDASDALQRAIDSGAETVFLPHGVYVLRRPVRLAPTLRVLQGCGSILIGDGHAEALAGRGMLEVEDAAAQPLFLDRLSLASMDKGAHRFVKVRHAAARDLVVLHSRWMSYASAAPASGDCGRLFVDDMCGGPWTFAVRQQAFLRSLNVEGRHLMVDNRAADLWILSYKTEGLGVALRTAAGARSEVLGGFHFPAAVWPPGGEAYRTPYLVIEDGGACSTIQALEWANTWLVEESVPSGLFRLTAEPGTRRWLAYRSRR